MSCLVLPCMLGSRYFKDIRERERESRGGNFQSLRVYCQEKPSNSVGNTVLFIFFSYPSLRDVAQTDVRHSLRPPFLKWENVQKINGAFCDSKFRRQKKLPKGLPHSFINILVFFSPSPFQPFLSLSIRVDPLDMKVLPKPPLGPS